MKIINEQLLENNKVMMIKLKDLSDDIKSINSNEKIQQHLRVLDDFSATRNNVKVTREGSMLHSTSSPPPPPPPPPPLPSASLLNTSMTSSPKQASSTTKYSNKQQNRPAITVEDLLKVTLKKTSQNNQVSVNLLSYYFN